MKLLELARKDVLLMVRDRKALMIIIVMPLVLTAILGLGLGSMFNGPTSSIGQAFTVMVADEDQGKMGDTLVTVLSSDELKKLVKVQTATTAEAVAAVDQKKAPAALIIPKDFSRRVERGEKTSIEVYGHPDTALKTGIVSAIANAYTDHFSAIEVSIATGLQIWLEKGAVAPQEAAQAAATLQAGLIDQAHQTTAQIKYEAVEPRKGVTSFQYYAAAMAVMFCLFATTANGGKSFLEERQDGTLPRIMTTPTPRWQVIGGKLIGTFLVALLQFAVMIAFTALVFRVNWGSSIGGLAVMVLSICVGAAGVAVFIASISKTAAVSDIISMVFIQLSTLLGGGMVPTYGFPELGQKLSLFTFNGLADKGLVALMEGQTLSAVWTPALILTAAGLVLSLIGARRLAS